MISGKCPVCSIKYYGWALRYSENQYCKKCGSLLDINEAANEINPSSDNSSIFEEYLSNIQRDKPMDKDANP